jgi:hypothetical protein
VVSSSEHFFSLRVAGDQQMVCRQCHICRRAPRTANKACAVAAVCSHTCLLCCSWRLSRTVVDLCVFDCILLTSPCTTGMDQVPAGAVCASLDGDADRIVFFIKR